MAQQQLKNRKQLDAMAERAGNNLNNGNTTTDTGQKGTVFAEGTYDEWVVDGHRAEFDDWLAENPFTPSTPKYPSGYIKPMGFDSPFFAPSLALKGFFTSLSNGSKILKPLKIAKPNALNKTIPGFTDKVPGSIYRTGRGPLKDFATQKPALSPMNYHKYNKLGRWSIGIGTSGASVYYFYKQLYK